MPGARPFFSILVPTRNRAGLLCDSALPSVLRQTWADFEIVVCDNASADDTGARVAALGDARLRYVRSDDWIPKEHFFEFALRQARGEFSLLFFDDDVMQAHALASAHRLLAGSGADSLVFSCQGVYFYPNWMEPLRRNVLHLPRYSGRATRIDAASHLAAFYRRLDLLPETPMVTNTFFRSARIQALLERHGHIYRHGHMGDYENAVYWLTAIDSFVHLDEPLVIFGHWASNTSQQLRNQQATMPEYSAWIAEFTAEHLQRMPFRQYLWSNCVAAALQNMSAQLGLPYAVDRGTYFAALRAEIRALAAAGVDRSALLPAIDAAEAEAGAAAHGSAAPPAPASAAAAPLAIAPATAAGANEIPLFLDGATQGFDSILGALLALERLRAAGDGDECAPLVRARFERERILRSLGSLLLGIVNSGQPRRIVLIGDGSIAKLAALALGEQVVAVIAADAPAAGAAFHRALRRYPPAALARLECDLVIDTQPNDASLAEAVADCLARGPSAGAAVVRA